jgi:predicted nucleic acid-binding protein
MPTAGPESQDADAILAAVAATIGTEGDEVVIATTNPRHFGRFPGVLAREWRQVR